MLSLAACGGRTGDDLYGYDAGTGSSLPANDGKGGSGQGATSGSPSSGASTSTGGGSTTGGSGSTTGGSTGTAGSTQAGAPSKGGAPGTGGFAGSSGGFGQAGAAGSGGVTGLVQVACTELCIDPTSPCPDQFGPGVQCVNDCFQALTIRGGVCQDIGAQLAFCFKDAASKFGSDCSTGANQAPVICSGLLNTYQACASGSSTPPPPPPVACSGSGGAAPGKCSQNQMCSDGTYFSVSCYEQSPNQSACTCSSPNVTSNITLNESAIYACNDAFVACNGTILPK